MRNRWLGLGLALALVVIVAAPASAHQPLFEEGMVGCYVSVIGDKERPGGDPAFPSKMRDYWAPVPQPATQSPTAPDAGHARTCGGY